MSSFCLAIAIAMTGLSGEDRDCESDGGRPAMINQCQLPIPRPAKTEVKWLEHLYRTKYPHVDWDEFDRLERKLLAHPDYKRCVQCGQVFGPGLTHPYRHPARDIEQYWRDNRIADRVLSQLAKPELNVNPNPNGETHTKGR